VLRFLSSVITGLGLGSIYALIAIGFVIIYKSTRVISFAQPGLMIVGGMWTYFFTRVFDLSFFVAVPLAAVVTAGVGLVIERLALRPLVGKPVFVAAIVTIGVDIVMRVTTNRFIGIQTRQARDPWGLETMASLRSLGLFVQQRYVAMFVTLLVVVALLSVFFKFSRTGLAMRAAAFDQETALAQGVNVGTVFALSWALAGALAAIAGGFVGTGQGIDQTSWVIALKALPAIIIGGLDSLPGAVVGGLLVGVVEALFATYQADYMPWLGSNFSVVSPYVLLLVVLLVRPYGLFGTPEVERV
jgi:branched-chain amino acid transport system permease protein